MGKVAARLGAFFLKSARFVNIQTVVSMTASREVSTLPKIYGKNIRLSKQVFFYMQISPLQCPNTFHI